MNTYPTAIEIPSPQGGTFLARDLCVQGLRLFCILARAKELLAMPTDRLTTPQDAAAYLRDNGTVSAIISLSDADLDELIFALGYATTVARNIQYTRKMHQELPA